MYEYNNHMTTVNGAGLVALYFGDIMHADMFLITLLIRNRYLWDMEKCHFVMPSYSCTEMLIVFA